MVFKFLEKEVLPHEQVVFCNDYKTGLKAIIAIHNTTLGMSLGGCRMYPYKTEEEALKDVLNLSRAMSYKSACAGLKIGGGKSVIIGDPEKDKTPELLRSLGKYVESLSGKYTIAKDVGITGEDLKYIGEKTSYVVGKPKKEGGAGSPSYFTAKGVFLSLKLGVKLRLKKDSLKNIKVVIQGVGSVGRELMKLLLEEKADVFIFDVRDEVLKKMADKYPSVHILSSDKVFTTSCDVFAPCALGGVINDESLKTLDCALIAGGANNQLKYPEISKKLADKNILYFPDFIINSGGIIHAYSFFKFSKPTHWAEEKLKEIPDTLMSIYKSSLSQNISITEAAYQLAMERMTNTSCSEEEKLVL